MTHEHTETKRENEMQINATPEGSVSEVCVNNVFLSHFFGAPFAVVWALLCKQIQ